MYKWNANSYNVMTTPKVRGVELLSTVMRLCAANVDGYMRSSRYLENWVNFW